MLKLLLVGFMLLLGAKNRWRLTPNLGLALSDGNTVRTVSALRTSLLLEAAAALVILGLVSWLGMLDPKADVRVEVERLTMR